MSDLERVLADIQSEADRRTHIGQMPIARVLDALHAVQKDARAAVAEHGREVIQLVEDFRSQVAAVTRDNVIENHVKVAELRELGVQIELEEEDGFADAPKSDRQRDGWDEAIKGPNDSELRTASGLERALEQLGPLCGRGVKLTTERAKKILVVLDQYSDQKAVDMGHSHDAIQAVRKFARYIRLQARATSISSPVPPASQPSVPTHTAEPARVVGAASLQPAKLHAEKLPAGHSPQPPVKMAASSQPSSEPPIPQKQIPAPEAISPAVEPDEMLPASPTFTIEEPKGNWKKWTDNMIRTFLLRVDEGLLETPKRSIALTCRHYLLLPAQYKKFQGSHGASPSLVASSPKTVIAEDKSVTISPQSSDSPVAAPVTEDPQSTALFALVSDASAAQKPAPESSAAEQAKQFIAWLALATGTSIPNYKRALELAELNFSNHVRQEVHNHVGSDHPKWQDAYNAGLSVLRETFTTYVSSRDGHLIRDYAQPKIREAVMNALGIPHQTPSQGKASKPKITEKSAQEVLRRKRCVDWAKEQGRQNVYDYRGFVDWLRRFQMIWVYKLAENLFRDDRGKSTATERQVGNIGYSMLTSFIEKFDPDTMTIDQIKLSLEVEMEERMLECLQSPDKFPDSRK